MRVLVLGGSGYIGSRLCAVLRTSGWAQPVSASSRRGADAAGHMQLDTRDAAAMATALRDVDAVVNCVAGSAAAIAQGAGVLAQAGAAAGLARLVHLSSMAVYGTLEGQASEQAPMDPSLGWYARAKCEAEREIAVFAAAGGTAVILRPGCVFGPGSHLWVGRVGNWLRAKRLGDLGIAGDGWSNLVHVDDVCAAVLASLRLPRAPGQMQSFNLAAPDSPRWNHYFTDFALAIGATPVCRIAPAQLRADAWLAGPALKVAQVAMAKAGRQASTVPDPISPGLLGLWRRHLHLDCSAASKMLDLQWTPYNHGLALSAQWYQRESQYHAA